MSRTPPLKKAKEIAQASRRFPKKSLVIQGIKATLLKLLMKKRRDGKRRKSLYNKGYSGIYCILVKRKKTGPGIIPCGGGSVRNNETILHFY